MKRVILLFSLLALSNPILADDMTLEKYCDRSGEDAIAAHKELINSAHLSGELDSSLKAHFDSNLKEIEKNHEVLCYGGAHFDDELSAKGQHLILVFEAYRDGQIGPEDLDFFLDQLKRF